MMSSHSACPSGSRGSTLEDWVDLLLADEEWVRREFEDIVAAGWGGVEPPDPGTVRGSRRPRRPAYDVRQAPLGGARDRQAGERRWACQRSPPRGP